MDDAPLCLLIQEALHDPNRVEALALAIDQLPEVKKYLGPGWLPYYDRALETTQRDVQRNINRFPQMYKLNMGDVDHKNTSDSAQVRKCFINWVLMILKRDCHDIKRAEKNKPKIISTSTFMRGDDGLTVEETMADDLKITGIKRLLEEERRFMGRKIKRYIEEDPEMMLRNCHPRNRPNLHCQIMAQKLLLQEPPLRPRELAKELEVPEQTVYDRWKNYCLPLLLQIAQELGCE
jgi:hypothetical protein